MGVLLLGLLIGAALPASAQSSSAPARTVQAGRAGDKGPILVAPAEVQARADELRDATARPSSTDSGVAGQSAVFFEDLTRETPAARPAEHPMDREAVDGRLGSIDGMIEAAQRRYDLYKQNTTEVPDQELAGVIAFARKMRDQKRVVFSLDGSMPDNELGDFRYVKDSRDGGVIELNGSLALLATRVGEPLAYAILAHQAAHAKARGEGRLTPERVIDAEIEATRAEYEWLRVADPSTERRIVLHSALRLVLQRHPEDKITAQSILFLEHLLQVTYTDGEKEKLRELVKRLGYEDGGPGREGGVNPAATPIRA